MSIVGQIKNSEGRPIMVVTKNDQPISPMGEDLRRLVISMRAVLQRRYPNEMERKVAAMMIMRELGGT